MTGRGLAATALTLVAAATACDRGPPPLADCGGDLRGVWRDDRGRRWHVIADGPSWELYPMFDDTTLAPAAPSDLVVAPGTIDLPRVPPGAPAIDGGYRRRFERGGATCWARTPARLHACRGDRAALDVQPPGAPADLVTCAPAAPPAAETWALTRERP